MQLDPVIYKNFIDHLTIKELLSNLFHELSFLFNG